MANDNSPRRETPLDEQLAAYLDHELSADEHRHIEELLATDPNVRRRLRELEQTWELLDDLDTMPASGQFTQSTLEMVAVAAGHDVERWEAGSSRRRLMWLGGLLAALAAGFCVTALFWPDPNRQLMQDLSVLEHLDLYRRVGDVEFLRLLRKESLFLDDGIALPTDAITPPLNESPDQRHQRITQMTPGEKEKLARLQERFDTLGPDERERLRELDAAVRADVDPQQLRQIMVRYAEWIKTLPSFVPAELADLPLAARVASIKKRLKADPTRDGGKRLSAEDAAKLMSWLHACLMRHEDELLRTLSPQQRNNLPDATAQRRREALLFHWWQRWQAGDLGKPPLMTPDDLAELQGELSEKGRQRLASKPPREQWQQVSDWIRQAVRQRATRGLFPQFDDDRLAEFFDQLPEEQRDRLLVMPGDEMQRNLLRLYWSRTRSPDGSIRPDGRKHDKRPGDPGLPKRPRKFEQTSGGK